MILLFRKRLSPKRAAEPLLLRVKRSLIRSKTQLSDRDMYSSSSARPDTSVDEGGGLEQEDGRWSKEEDGLIAAPIRATAPRRAERLFNALTGRLFLLVVVATENAVNQVEGRIGGRVANSIRGVGSSTSLVAVLPVAPSRVALRRTSHRHGRYGENENEQYQKHHSSHPSPPFLRSGKCGCLYHRPSGLGCYTKFVRFVQYLTNNPLSGGSEGI